MSTKYLAAYALASLAKPSPAQSDVEAICKAVGIDVDADTLAFVMECVAGRDVAALVAEGAMKMSSMSAAAAGVPAAAGASAPAAGGAAAPAAAGKKDEPEEEGDDDMGFGLFD